MERRERLRVAKSLSSEGQSSSFRRRYCIEIMQMAHGRRPEKVDTYLIAEIVLIKSCPMQIDSALA